MNLWPAAWEGLLALTRSVWPDIPVERIYRVRHVANAEYKTLATPYAIIEIPPTGISEEWAGVGNAAYVPKVSFFRIEALTQEADNDAPMEVRLSALEDALRSVGVAGGQILDVGMPDVAQTNRINGELASKEVAHIGGAIVADILYLKA